MKNLLILLLTFMSVCLGCKEEQKEPIDGIIDECVGVAFYYLDNQSNNSFFIEFGGPALNQQLDTTTLINRQQRVLIGQDASFGSIPRPTETFSSFALYALEDGKKNIIYRQDPVQNALWVKRKHSLTNPDFGCQQVDYTLIITDEFFK